MENEMTSLEPEAEVLMDHPFLRVTFEARNELVQMTWKPASEDMSMEDLMALTLTYRDHIERLRPKVGIFDMRELHFLITPDLQEWVDANISPTEKATCRVQALLLPRDEIMVMSVEQLMEETHSAGLAIRIFEDLASARAWLL